MTSKQLAELRSGKKPKVKKKVPFQACRLESTANKREHWAVKAKRAKAQRELGRILAMGELSRGIQARTHAMTPPFEVTLTRIGKRLLDSDNLAHCFKGIQDGVADALGIDDGDVTKVKWVYAQRVGKEYDALVSICNK